MREVVLRLHLIGRMAAWTGRGQSVLPTGRKTRALLAILAMGGQRPVQRGRLAEMLWSRRPEEQARASLRQEIHRLLEALAPVGEAVLSIGRDHLAMRHDAVRVDVAEVFRASPTRPDAVSLLDADLLEDLDGLDPVFDSWLASERERLRDRGRLEAEAILRQQQDPDMVISIAQRLLAVDRAHEGAWRALMQAHARRGERSMAMEAYQRYRHALAEFLDAEPSEEMQRLMARIRAGTAPRRIAAVAAPGANASSPPPGLATPPPGLERWPSTPRAGFGPSRLGILPPLMVGATPEERPLATGLAEEITTALTGCRWVVLVSHAALARFVAETRDEAAIRRAFGVDFLLDGTIQSANKNLRINLRLIDVRAGNQVVWAGRFDGQSRDPFALQDQIAAEVVARIRPKILLGEAKRAAIGASRPRGTPEPA